MKSFKSFSSASSWGGFGRENLRMRPNYLHTADASFLTASAACAVSPSASIMALRADCQSDAT